MHNHPESCRFAEIRRGAQLSIAYRAISLVALYLMSACVDKSIPVVPAIPQVELIREIRIEPRGAMMAVGDNVATSVVATNVLNAEIPLTSQALVQYFPRDTTALRIDSTGVIHALQASASPVPIEVHVTQHGTTKIDSIFVQVTEAPTAVVDHFQLQLLPGDSSTMGMGSTKMLIANATTSDNRPIPNTYVRVEVSSELRSENIFSGGGVMALMFNGLNMILNIGYLGDFWVTASSNIYGVVVRDSIQLTGTHRPSLTISIQQDPKDPNGFFLPANIQEHVSYVQPCASITFENKMTVPVTVTFDDPEKTSACVSSDARGNITSIAPAKNARRKFRSQGQVRWTITRADGTMFSRPATGIVEVR